MHITRPVALIALACTFVCGAVAPLALTRTNDVEQLIAVDKRQQAAYLTKDMAALDEIFTDDYVLVLSNGTERTKAEILKNAASPGARWEINETSGWKVRVHDDTAIVVATLRQTRSRSRQAVRRQREVLRYVRSREWDLAERACACIEGGRGQVEPGTHSLSTKHFPKISPKAWRAAICSSSDIFSVIALAS